MLWYYTTCSSQSVNTVALRTATAIILHVLVWSQAILRAHLAAVTHIIATHMAAAPPTTATPITAIRVNAQINAMPAIAIAGLTSSDTH